MKVAMVGSRALDIREVGEHLVKTLAALPEGTEVLLRRGITTEPGEFEKLTQLLCINLKIPFSWRTPEPGGREEVFLRDIQMVSEADAVVAYFAPDAVMSGGTGHVVEKAMDLDRPVFAYAPNENGVDWVGGNEPAHAVGLNL